MTPSDVCKKLASLIIEQDPEGGRTARAFREAFDYAYNGAKTGRYRPDQLSKTESAHIGSLVEINLRREFNSFIGDGQSMDYSIDGYDVDCKYSKLPFGWSIPLETHNNYAMVCHASDTNSTWRLGFVYIDPSYLNAGRNRDQKTTLRKDARVHIKWAWYDAPLPQNTLLHLDPRDANKILSKKSGQQRVNELFRMAQNVVIPRGVIETVAQQKDPMKRVRDNGGARPALRPEGIIILGDYLVHRNVAANLGLPVPLPGSFVATRVVPAEPNSTSLTTYLDKTLWRIATKADPVVPAPDTSRKAMESYAEDQLDLSFGSGDALL